MRAIIVTQEEFNKLNSRIQQYCINNIAGYKADKWAEELIHPVDKRIVMAIEDRILKALKTEEKNKIENLIQDWFPINFI